LTHCDKLKLVDKNDKQINLTRQAELLDLSRSSLYYQPVKVSAEDKEIMDLIDKIYTDYPFYGNRRIKAELNHEHNIPIGRKHTRTLMHIMGLEAIYPKPKLSTPGDNHKIYPYLLRNVKITKPNHVWSTDITYVKLEQGWAYLVAVIDWYSRYVIDWKLSNNLEIEFCLNCLNDSLEKGITPKIFNSDQGSHFTSKRFTSILKNNEISISMDGRGRCLDNIFVERLWRSVKQENIYLNNYLDVKDARSGLTEYFKFYNQKRRHQSLGYKTPIEIYFEN